MVKCDIKTVLWNEYGTSMAAAQKINKYFKINRKAKY